MHCIESDTELILKPVHFQIDAIKNTIEFIIKEIANSFIDFVYPAYCLSCKRRLEGRDCLLCPTCWHDLPLFPENYSIVEEIRQKSEHNRYLTHVFSIYEFSEIVKSFIHQLKYEHRPIVAAYILKHMPNSFIKALWSLHTDIIIPVPLHRRRKKERGYNQSAVIGKYLSKILQTPQCETCLHRIVYTKTQTKLDINQRIENVTGVFIVSESKVILNKKILIVDDVITTGSTINACAKELLSCGASEINAFSLAKVK